MVFPELLRRVFAGDSSQDLLTTYNWMSEYGLNRCACALQLNTGVHLRAMVPVAGAGADIDADVHARFGHTWVVILKLGQIVDIVVDNDPERVAFVVRRNVGFTKRFRHGTDGGCATRAQKYDYSR